MRIILPLLFPVFLLITQPCIAIREGTATADIFIKRYARAADFRKLALWHEAAAECLRHISVPMNEIAHDYYLRRGYKQSAARAKKEAGEIQEQYKYHRKQAKIAWQKSETPKRLLNTEREKIAKFMAIWLPRYPNRFYEYGIYPTFFRKHREMAEQKGDYVKALQLEADAAEMCATQYEKIPIAYGLEGYQKHRDAYQRHAALLRGLTQQNLKALPTEADKGKDIISSLETRSLYPCQKGDAILRIAKSDARVKAALGDQIGVHAYPSFQGFVWIVSFSNHSSGNIVTAIVDEKTAKVLDVF
ncbi:hypothetical protein F4054_14640 [Candidatus Poribacteria bacterium]|nr:hypothetical protein [Candidatus Poribacteria bacterium]MYK23485.1 hypothetical protein [Candidatus Poribacteria bacterium]